MEQITCGTEPNQTTVTTITRSTDKNTRKTARKRQWKLCYQNYITNLVLGEHVIKECNIMGNTPNKTQRKHYHAMVSCYPVWNLPVCFVRFSYMTTEQLTISFFLSISNPFLISYIAVSRSFLFRANKQSPIGVICANEMEMNIAWVFWSAASR